MSKLKAIIKEGTVHQIIVATDEHAATLPGTIIDVTDIECAIGWEYDGTNLTAPVNEEDPVEVEKTLEELQMEWRNAELRLTDHYVPITDHPDHAKILEFRQKLRDWPTTVDFPDTRPTAD